MKFVYFGYDFAIDTIYRLIDDGHEPVGIFTFECDNLFNFNEQTHTLAQTLNIPITQSPPTAERLRDFTNQGAELLLAIGYPHKIPVLSNYSDAYAVNIHPSRLPKGRGIIPTPTIIIHEPDAAGLTAHKITPQFDAGDILAQIPFELSPRETVETYSTRIAMALPNFTSNLIADLANIWNSARAQEPAEASHFAPPSDEMRTLNWDQTIAKIDAQSRAFGSFGTLFGLNNELWAAYAIDTWEEPHNHKPGTLCHTTAREITIAAKDGYVCIKNAEKLGPMPT